ncbi:MAG: galactokinase [Phycisphaerae bacterium]|nr:galactokinase [Phycisphaerae bacterium]
MSTQKIKDEFRKAFGVTPKGIVAAPGRVNLIGEHTDYNDGFVLPIAIEQRTLAAWAPRDDGRVVFASLQQPNKCDEIDLCTAIETGQHAWGNYCRGVAAGLIENGIELAGCNILFDSNVPLNAGLSSSASLEVATGVALLAVCGSESSVKPHLLAKICQHAENTFAGAPCGIMDQSISVMGQANHALLLDCRSGQTRQIPFDAPNTVLLVVDTQVSHDIGDGGYPARRKQCEAAAEILGIPALRDATEEMIAQAVAASKISDLQMRRSRHVVTEIARTLAAADLLTFKADGYLQKFGELMYASHASLRDDFEVSCPELDTIVDLAIPRSGVFGARMTGGGFGGCAIVLVEENHAESVTQVISDGFKKQYHRRPPIFATHPAPGAMLIE